MDRPLAPRSRGRRRVAVGAGVALATVVTLALFRLPAAVPAVDAGTLLVDTVRRGPIVFQVRGTGTLVPVDVRILTAQTAATVERVVAFAGAEVSEGTLIAELASPELAQAAQESAWNLKRAGSEYDLAHLGQKGTVASARAAAREARAALEASRRLREEGLQGDADLLRAEARNEDCAARLATEELRLALYEGKDGRAAPARAALEQARAQHALKQAQVAALHVRAGMSGILQQLPLQVGQSLAPGAVLARVARSLPLRAQLKVPESQAKDVQLGQRVTVDTRDGVVEGRVCRIDPAVQNGTVTVDAELPAALPRGARPDLGVEGIVELDRAADSLFVGRPALAAPGATVGLFRLSADGREARRVRVRLGRASVATVEVVAGLSAGDRVILSDTTAWDGADRLRLR